MIRLARQKEFNIIGDIYHSGLGRAARKNIGRFRRSVANSLADSAHSSYEKLGKTARQYFAEGGVNDPTITKKLIQRGRSLGIRTIDNTGYGSFVVPRSTILENEAAIGSKKIINAAKGGKSVVLFDKNGGVNALSHELGHVKNAKDKGIKKLLQRAGTNESYRLKINDPDLSDISKAKSLKEIAKDYVKGKAAILEETRATNRGLNMMKEAGATKEQLAAGRKINNIGTDTYRHGSSMINKAGLANFLQIPSKKGEYVKSRVLGLV